MGDLPHDSTWVTCTILGDLVTCEGCHDMGGIDQKNWCVWGDCACEKLGGYRIYAGMSILYTQIKDKRKINGLIE